MVLHRSMLNWRRGWDQSGMGISEFCYIQNICGVMVFQKPMLNWRVYISVRYMCILQYVKLLWCSGDA